MGLLLTELGYGATLSNQADLITWKAVCPKNMTSFHSFTLAQTWHSLVYEILWKRRSWRYYTAPLPAPHPLTLYHALLHHHVFFRNGENSSCTVDEFWRGWALSISPPWPHGFHCRFFVVVVVARDVSVCQSDSDITTELSSGPRSWPTLTVSSDCTWQLESTFIHQQIREQRAEKQLELIIFSLPLVSSWSWVNIMSLSTWELPDILLYGCFCFHQHPFFSGTGCFLCTPVFDHPGLVVHAPPANFP